jgi:hypothetical protein
MNYLTLKEGDFRCQVVAIAVNPPLRVLQIVQGQPVHVNLINTNGACAPLVLFVNSELNVASNCSK